MSFVLAINSGSHPDRAIDQLTREFAGREFVVVSSCAEALDVIERRVPDLVVFPVSMSPADEVAVVHRLYAARSDDPRRLGLPMLSLARPGATSLRWFYWFKPASIRTADDARFFTDGLREQVRALLPNAPSQVAAAEALPAYEGRPEPVLSVMAPVTATLPASVPVTAPLAAANVEADEGSAIVSPRMSVGFGMFADHDEGAPEPDAPRLWSRAIGLLAQGRAAAEGASEAAAPLGEAMRWWAPRAAAAVVIVATGVFARSYWLAIVPRLEEATRLAAAATAPTARAEANAVPAGGSLAVTSGTNRAAVVVDGQPKGLTPLTIDGLTPGSHAVVVKSAQGTIERTVVVKLNQTATLDASIYSGWLAVFSPIEIQVFDGKRLLRLDEQNRVMLSPGRHDLRFSNKTLGYEERRVVQMKPGEVAPLTVVPPKSTISISTSVPAEVWIDGARVGDTPVVDWPVEIGTREVVLRGPGEHRLTVTATVAPVRLNVDLSTPSRPGA